MTEDEKKKLAKRVWGRCYMRILRAEKRKPTKEEMEDCMKTEIYKETHGLVEKRKKGRKSSEESFFDAMKEKEKEVINLADEMLTLGLLLKRA